LPACQASQPASQHSQPAAFSLKKDRNISTFSSNNTATASCASYL